MCPNNAVMFKGERKGGLRIKEVIGKPPAPATRPANSLEEPPPMTDNDIPF